MIWRGLIEIMAKIYDSKQKKYVDEVDLETGEALEEIDEFPELTEYKKDFLENQNPILHVPMNSNGIF